MKILFISAFPPNQKTAGQDYTRRLILDLLDKGHSVSIIYAEYPNHSIELLDSIKIEGILKPSVSNCIKKLMFHPFFTRRFDKSILSKIQAIASGFDIPSASVDSRLFQWLRTGHADGIPCPLR